MTQDEAFRKLNVTVDLIPPGSSNRPGTRIRPTFVTLHNTANAAAGADAAMHARYLRGADARARRVSWHFTVDDERVFKHLPTNELGWHAGPGNSRSIGIEVCENRGIDTAAAIDRAALLTALMMVFYGIGPENVVTHQKWTGKDCPRVILRRRGGFDAFRDRAAIYAEELGAARERDAREGADLEAVPAEAGDDLAGFDLAMLADPDDAGAPGGGEDRIARLERLVGRLTLEIHDLREALEEARGTARTLELEAD
jgi:hypothetical protein